MHAILFEFGQFFSLQLLDAHATCAFRKPVRPRKNARGIQTSIVAPTVEDLLALVDETGQGKGRGGGGGRG